jgi:tetratricopeptide (TPR) repeat protein
MWVELFENNPTMKQFDPETYLRGMNHLLTALFYAGDADRHQAQLKNLERFILQSAENFDTNLEVQAFVFLYTARLNKHFLEGTFSKGLFLVPELEAKLAHYDAYLDHHRRLVFWYKTACLYFGSGDNDKCILYLNRIINYKAGNLLSDLQCYARILHLIAHYELGHYYLLEYLVKSVYRFLGKMNDLNVVQKEILGFLRKEIRTSPTSLKGAFIKLHDKLQPYQASPHESRAFLYLDVLSWLECKIKGVTVQEIIRDKYLRRKAE